MITASIYLKIATDRLAFAVTQLGEDQRRLRGLLVAKQAAVNDAATALSATLAARTSVLATVASERNLYSSTNHRLNALVAAKASAAAAAALARQEAAAAAAARAGTTTRAIPAGPPSVAALPALTSTTVAPTSLAAKFAAIRNCESSDTYTLNTGNGYYGAYQFSEATWHGLGGVGLPSAAAPAVQDALAYLLYQRTGNSFESWSSCAAIEGLA
jgi:hypothetical protein